MINEEQKQKFNVFLERFIGMQQSKTHELGLVVVKSDEDLAETLTIIKNKEDVAVAKLTRKVLATDFIVGLKENLAKEKGLVVELGNYLNPKIYNQFYLISQQDKLEYFSQGEEVIFKLPQKTWILVLAKQSDLDSLNYPDFYNIVGPVFNFN